MSTSNPACAAATGGDGAKENEAQAPRATGDPVITLPFFLRLISMAHRYQVQDVCSACERLLSKSCAAYSPTRTSFATSDHDMVVDILGKGALDESTGAAAFD